MSSLSRRVFGSAFQAGNTVTRTVPKSVGQRPLGVVHQARIFRVIVFELNAVHNGGCKHSPNEDECQESSPTLDREQRVTLARSDHRETLTARGQVDCLATESIAWTLSRGNWASSLSELGSCFQEDGPQRNPFDWGPAGAL